MNEKRHFMRLVVRWCLDKIKNAENLANQNKIIAELVAISRANKSKKVIIFPATIDFHYMAQRPQQIARAFANKGYLVIYGTLNNQADQVTVAERVEENIYLINETFFNLLNHAFKPEDTLYYCLWPNNIKHLEYLPYSQLIYDYMDDLALLELPMEQIERQHNEMLKRADLITVTSDRLFNTIPDYYRDKTLLLNNAVSDEFIEAVDACEKMPEELSQFDSKPVVGYFGAFAKWFDFELIAMVADTISDAQLVLIGPVDADVQQSMTSLLEKHPNILHLKQKSQIELVPYLKRFDVCIIPFLKNGLTDAVSPVKLYEYLSAGKPVVTTDLHECKKYNQVTCTQNTEDFLDQIKTVLHTKDAESRYDDLKRFARENTWNRRVDHVVSELKHSKNLNN